jgi:hypothetical protein
MKNANVLVLLCFLVAVVLGVVSWWLPRLVGPAVAALALGLVVQEL